MAARCRCGGRSYACHVDELEAIEERDAFEERVAEDGRRHDEEVFVL
jgi:hypothetical protein